MKIELNDDGWKDIEQSVAELQKKVGDNELKKILRKIGQIVKKKVTEFAPSRSQEPSFSDFSPGEYKHIVDDVTFKVKQSTTGQLYVSIKGGKQTGYKWLWVNDGHVTENGTRVPGNHFIDKATVASEKDIDDAVNKFLEDVFNGFAD